VLIMKMKEMRREKGGGWEFRASYLGPSILHFTSLHLTSKFGIYPSFIPSYYIFKSSSRVSKYPDTYLSV
jgi:hypothetical protein